MTERTPLVDIEVIGSTVKLYQPLDIDELSSSLDISGRDSESLFYKLQVENEIQFIIFGSGFIVCVGARSEREIEQAVEKFLQILRGVGVKITKRPIIETENIIANGRLGVDLNLETVVRTLENTAIISKPEALVEDFSFLTTNYEFEPFPWVMHNMKKPEVTIFMFGLGKFAIVRAKSEQAIYEAAKKFRDRLVKLGIM